jgi:LPXTG-motif cell wall-anchored protein
MNMTNTQWILIAGAVAAALIALAVWFLHRKKQSKRLQDRFGPEYGRTVVDLGSKRKAESELQARERRIEGLDIAPLVPAEAARFTEAWNALQGRFVDNPQGVVVQADQLVRELMLKRGYPMGDFEHRAADISVDHPAVVNNYRAAQAIAVRGERGQANTEELRKAVVHYRALFDELLEVEEIKRGVARTEQMAVNS